MSSSCVRGARSEPTLLHDEICARSFDGAALFLNERVVKATCRVRDQRPKLSLDYADRFCSLVALR